MTELFPITLKLPEGFSYHDNFLTVGEEHRLLEFIRTIELRPMLFQGFEAKRKLASFGYDYSFDTRKLTKGKEIPRALHWLVDKVADRLNLSSDVFAELLVTEYPVGSVINWHRDAPPFDVIAGISLSSDCVFKLKPHNQAKPSRKETVSLTVERRSLYVMSGISREEWQHCTAPVQAVRRSVTLRTLKS